MRLLADTPVARDRDRVTAASRASGTAGAFGHPGGGGSSHGARPSLRTGFSYITAALRSEDDDQRAHTVFTALREVAAVA